MAQHQRVLILGFRYVHRVGRTGRLASDGHALSFFTRNMAPVASQLLELLQVRAAHRFACLTVHAISSDWFALLIHAWLG